MKDVKMRVGGNYIREGKYLLRMDCIKLDKDKGQKAFMAVEMTVVKILDETEVLNGVTFVKGADV